MKSSRTVRLLDQYIGKFLCWFLSVPNFLVSRHHIPQQKKQNKVLIVEFFEMGAAIMTAPALNFLRGKVPNTELYCLTTESMKESWEVLRVISPQNIFTIKDKTVFGFIFSSLKTVAKMRKFYFDLIIDYELFFRISTVLIALLRAKTRAGFYRYQLEGLSRGRIYSITCSYNQNMHISKNFLALTKTAFLNCSDHPNFKGCVAKEELDLPDYHTDEASRQSVHRKLKNFFPQGVKENLLVVSHDVGADLAIRNFPPQRFVEVINQALQKNSNLSVVLVGTQKEANSAHWICNQVGNENCINFAGNTTFHELLELVKMATVVLCNDNGIAHFAAFTRTRTVALFSTDSPFVYGPLGPCTIIYSFFHCSPCISAFNHKYSKCRDNKCLQAISSSTVSEYVQQALEGRTMSGTVNNTIPYLF